MRAAIYGSGFACVVDSDAGKCTVDMHHLERCCYSCLADACVRAATGSCPFPKCHSYMDSFL